MGVAAAGVGVETALELVAGSIQGRKLGASNSDLCVDGAEGEGGCVSAAVRMTHLPVLPNPLVPRSVSGSRSTSANTAATHGTMTSCATRSPGTTV